MALFHWFWLGIMQTPSPWSSVAHFGERVTMAIGAVASGNGLLSLLSCGLGWSGIPDFLWLWLCLCAATTPLIPLIYRGLRPLFWCR